jgi:PilZ domain-containing protein
MTTEHVDLERRATQRFEVQTPVSFRLSGTEIAGSGFTQDLSGRGALLYTDTELSAGDVVELTLMMPAEITLAENMRVRCKGRVVRVCGAGSKGGVAVQLEGAYEFLPNEITQLTQARIASGEQADEAGMSANVFQLRSGFSS